ncbi:MAG: chemotaxis-specific protein-glutamate methyltransferase CheB [Desulfobacteraceae bacterium]|nr:chemotaxis-specific protein-glutamate methyltransferase CheB [Desulfobacteraceae bacterium]
MTIHVLIVDDSLTTREYLRHIITSDPDLAIIGEAKNGKEALEMAESEKPDVIIMDIQMPGMNGYEATRAIMERCPAPIVIHSTLVAPGQTENIFKAMKAGAVAVVQKPTGIGHPEAPVLIEKLLRAVRLMSEVKVVRLLKQKNKAHHSLTVPGKDSLSEPAAGQSRPLTSVIAIGASTGGPPVLQAILDNLENRFSIPVIIAQHIASGFLEGMVDWLSKTAHLVLKIARTGEPVADGNVYFTPEDYYTTVTSARTFLLTPINDKESRKRPISKLFSSIADVYKNTAVGVLLTGMGNDGVSGLKKMKDQGAVTIVQDKESAIVFGMPGEAIRINAATYVLRPEDITSYLNKISRDTHGKPAHK